MKKFVYTLALLSIVMSAAAQKPVQKGVSPFREVGTFKWNTPNGLPYIQSFSGNYSAEVFRQPAKGRLAFLSRAKHALLLFNTVTGKKEKSIPLPFSPIDFAVAKGHYYIAGTQNLYQLDLTGKIIREWYFGDHIRFVNDIKVINNRVCLITPGQKTWALDPAGSRFGEEDGIILSKDWMGKALKKGKFRFQIMLTGRGDSLITKDITTTKPLGTIKLIGLRDNLLFVEVQAIEKEVPLKVSREIRVYHLEKSNLKQVSALPMPDLSYTYIKHDVTVSASGLSVFISAPEKAYVYRLINLKEGGIAPHLRLPSHFYQTSYQYNNHLLPAMESSPTTFKNVKSTPITRKKIIQNAEPYATHKWFCHYNNIWDRDCGSAHVRTPSWVTVGNNISVPYMWGGFSSLSQFDQGIANGASAGDCDTHSVASPSCAVGVDCSGFVSRAWGLGTKYCTRCIPDISTQYPSYDDLKPGDVVNYAGHHVRLIHTVNGNGSFLIIEAAASSTDWRVGYNNYSVADFQGRYLPRYYNHVTSGKVDTEPPATSIQAKKWETGNFTVHFTDSDNAEVKDRFYLVSYFDGSQWLANEKNGFFNDNFSKGLNSYWTKVSGNWNVVQNTLNQSDEGNSNTNIYAPATQNAKKYSYAYSWRMKIGGSGDNRRAGLVFMCDGPAQSQRHNSYMVYYRVDNNTCQIYKSVNNSIHIKTSDACTVNAGQWFNAKVIFNARTGEITAYKNDTLVSVWIDATPLTAGNSISLRTGNANVSYDNIMVYRSRTASAFVTTQTGNDVPFQDPSPGQPACRIFSLVADSMHNQSPVDTAWINIDWTPPVNFTVNDGKGNDIDTTHATDRLSANWTASSDPNSGIAAYRCCAGTTPGSSDIIGWFNNGKATSFTKTGLSLKEGVTWYVSVVAVNGAGLTSDTIVSDGAKVEKPAGIPEKPLGNIRIYPVPAGHTLWIKPEKESLTSEPALYNLSGKKCPVTVTPLPERGWEMNLKPVPAGFYLIRLCTPEGTFWKKIIIKK